MNKILSYSILLFSITGMHSQSMSSYFINQSKVNTPAGWCYQTTQIEIRTDSTYVMTSSECGPKKDLRSLRNWNAQIDSGVISVSGEYHILTQVRNGVKGQQWPVKINNHRLIFFFQDDFGHMEKVASYNRIRKENH